MSTKNIDYNLIAPFIQKLIESTESGYIEWRQYGLAEEIKTQYLYKAISNEQTRFFLETQSIPDMQLIIYRQDTEESEMATILKIICNDAFSTEAIILQEEFQSDLWALLGVAHNSICQNTDKSISMLVREFLNS